MYHIGVVFIAILSMTLNFSKSQMNGVDNEYFQGEVSFKISNESLLPEAISDSKLDELFGKVMVGVVKEDKYKTIQETSANGKLIAIYDLKRMKIFYDYEDSDTIFWYPLDEEPGKLISIEKNKQPKKEILGQLRESITIEYKPDSPYIENFIGTYYFHPKYKLNKKLYSNHKSSFWNLFVNEAGAISIRNEIYLFPLYKQVYQVIKITPRIVKESEFILNQEKIIAKGPE